MSLTLDIEDAHWRKLRGLSPRLKAAVKAALAAAGASEKADLTVLLTSDERVHALNRDFRGKDKPTNVLSFPAGRSGYLGDIAIAFGVTASEAKTEDKALIDHATHLTVHGVLHLLGYDHITARQAKRMEPLETAILASMNISDPYKAR